MSNELTDQINTKRREIKTDGYPMSISEWVSMYESQELDIHPEFQRVYRWSSTQKSSLIESLLLGIPLPAVFVSQRQDGVWDVVDGLQRLSTIFQFVGVLKDEDNKLIAPLALDGTSHLPALKGITWASLPKEFQLVLKRTKISASIILKESDDTAKYDLFQRLNTGGTALSQQEVRNCLLVMLNRDLFIWLKTLQTEQSFISTTALSDRLTEESYDAELILRFILLTEATNDQIRSIGDVGVFLNEKMTDLASNRDFSTKETEDLFRKTFQILEHHLGSDAFRRFNVTKNKFEGGFLVSVYEVVALGIAFNIKNNTLCDPNDIINKAKSIWTTQDFTNWSASGMTATRRLPKLIPFGRNLFSNQN